MKPITRHFTFGSGHACSHPEMRSHISNHWVSVTLPEGHAKTHRQVFIEQFTEHYCPRPNQFAFEYGDNLFDATYFPAGELVEIKEGFEDAESG
jgi:hypothetical protein